MFSALSILVLCVLNATCLLAQLSSLSTTGGQFGVAPSSEIGGLSKYPSSSSFGGLSSGSVYSPYSSSTPYRGSSYGQGQGISPYSSSAYSYNQQGSLYGSGGVSPFSSSSLYGNALSPYGSSSLYGQGSSLGSGASPYSSSSSPYGQGSSLGSGASPYSSSSSPAYCCVSMSNPMPSTSYGSSAIAPSIPSSSLYNAGALSSYGSSTIAPSIPSSSLYNAGALSPYGSYSPTSASSYSSGVGSSPYTYIQPSSPAASVICYPLCPNAYGSGMGSYGGGLQSGFGSPYSSGFGAASPYSSAYGAPTPYYSDFGSTYPYTSSGFGSGATNYPFSAGFGPQYSGATNIHPYSSFNGGGFDGLTGTELGTESFGNNRFGSSSFPRRATSTHSTISPGSEQITVKAGNKSKIETEESLAHVPYKAAVKKQLN